jgi:hypothetical protein
MLWLRRQESYKSDLQANKNGNSSDLESSIAKYLSGQLTALSHSHSGDGEDEKKVIGALSELESIEKLSAKTILLINLMKVRLNSQFIFF